jgi:hypothetical protein
MVSAAHLNGALVWWVNMMSGERARAAAGPVTEQECDHALSVAWKLAP